MKFKFWQLFGWFFLVEILFLSREELINGFQLRKAFDWLFEFKYFVLYVTSTIPFFLFSLCAYSAFYFFYQTRERWLVIPLSLLGIIFGVGARYVLQEVIQKALFGFGNYFNHDAMSYFLDNLFFGITFATYGIIFYFIQYSKYQESRRNALILENKQSELSLLRSQVNPHFLFNTLNNIYTLIYSKSDDALKAVERLTGLLRYALYEKEELVSIAKEVKAIEDFVDLQKIRYAYDLALDLDLEDACENVEIPPFLLIPFVENAFKHGSFKDEENPVCIQLKCKDDELCFFVENLIAKQEKDQVGGIGLNNLKKRLDLIYGERYSMKIESTEKQFRASLKLPKKI